MVGPTAADCAGADRLQHLRAVGRTPERVLLRAAVPVAVLLAVPGSELRAPHPATVWLMVEPIACLFGPGYPTRVPGDLLLLPQGVLPVVLLVTAGVRGARCPA